MQFLVYLIEQTDRLVLTDIDGTITKANIRGRVYPAFGLDAHQEGVVDLFDDAVRHGYTMFYLTGRSMAEDESTRSYLFETLDAPFGPLLMAPKSVAGALLDETVGSPAETKAETIESVLDLFEVGVEAVHVAYGNKDTDTEAYSKAGIPEDKIYIINEESVLRRISDDRISSYPDQAENINQFFPILNKVN